MIRLVCLLIGYIFGCFQTSYIYGKLHGIDIRQYGSGNAGTTNSLRVLGKKAGAIVLFCDILKTGLAMTVVRLLFKEQYGDILYLLAIYAAAGAILGHNFPFYLGFKGGKGIACTAGLVIFFHPYMIIPQIITFFGIFFCDALCVTGFAGGGDRADRGDGHFRSDGTVGNGTGGTE